MDMQAITVSDVHQTVVTLFRDCTNSFDIAYAALPNSSEQLRHTNTGNGGARRRASASLSRGRAPPSSGTDRRSRP
eukprot:6197594-Pleurochrysis_carterae.AAC.1